MDPTEHASIATPRYLPHRHCEQAFGEAQFEGGETMSLLREDLAAMAEHHNPHRDDVLQLVMETHAEHFGPSIPVNLEWLNRLLAKYGQPLATETEINVFYSRKVPPRQRY